MLSIRCFQKRVVKTRNTRLVSLLCPFPRRDKKEILACSPYLLQGKGHNKGLSKGYRLVSLEGIRKAVIPSRDTSHYLLLRKGYRDTGIQGYRDTLYLLFFFYNLSLSKIVFIREFLNRTDSVFEKQPCIPF